MFCPNCKTEYREGFTNCADCQIPLVTALPADEPERNAGGLPEGKFVEYLRTNDIGDIMVLKSILSGGNVRYFIRDENINILYPFLQAAILMVDERDTEKVRELLADVQLRYIRTFFKPE